MEKILFDCTYYQGGTRFHGGGEYGDVIFEALIKSGASTGCGLFFREKYGLKNTTIELATKANWKFHPMDMMREVPDIVRKHGYTTIYSSLPYANNWYWLKDMDNIRFVGTFHGLRQMELGFYKQCEKSFFDKDGYLCPSSMNKDFQDARGGYNQSLTSISNTQVVTVSEHSKYSILHYFPELKNNIHVYYSPEKIVEYQPTIEDETRILKDLGVKNNNFAFMTSGDIWYKNPKRAMLAFDMIFSERYSFIPNNYKFIVVGGLDNKEKLLDGINNKDRFLILDYVNTEELEILYKNTHLFIYPSLNEGFGYPPLEAMKYGTLCVCSVNTSISEICGDMVWYFNPLDVDEMAIRIMQAFSLSEREKKKKKITELLPRVNERQREDLRKIVKLIMNE